MTPLELARSYTAHGIPVFPCRHANEETNTFDPETGEEIVYKAKTPLVSTGFKGATLNERLVRILFGERHPNAMVGIPTGEQLGAWVLDVDVHKDDAGQVTNGYATLEALESTHGPLPDTAQAQTAGGGRHYYFRYVPGVRNRGKLGPGLDVRGAGGYVIAPGSVTAEGKEYVWLDHDGDGLPPIADAPDWLLELVLPPEEVRDSAPGNYTYEPGDHSAYVEHAVEAELRELASTSQGGRGEAVNRSAFSLGTLVGAGVLSRAEAEAGLYDAAYANGVVAKDGEKEIRRKIKRGLDAGIKQPRQMPEPEPQENWPTINVTALIENARRKRAAADAIEPEEPMPIEEAADYRLEAVSDLESLTYPGGLVEDLIDWIVSSAEQPSRSLALPAVLALMGALCARYTSTKRFTRPNLYTVALAGSGFGKDHARSQVKRLIMQSRGVFDKYSGPARIMSASALREILEEHRAVVCQIDEFGGFVRDITDRKANAHMKAISTDLRDYYSASSTYFEGAAYRGIAAKRVDNPNLCIHGTSTPEQFWSALSSSSAEDGLLPRLILFHIKGDKPKTVKPARDVEYVPTMLLSRLADVAGEDVVQHRTGNLGKLAPPKKTEPPRTVHIEWTPDAEAVLEAVKLRIEDQEPRVAPEARPFVRRIVENAIKLAIIVAAGKSPEKPVIKEADIDWASSVAWTCAAEMIQEVSERLADNQREANFKAIERILRGAGEAGMTEGKLADRLKGVETRQREDIVKDLLASGKVVRIEAKSPKGGRPSNRLQWAA